MISFRPVPQVAIKPVRPNQPEERQRQRTARREAALEQAGRDEQRLERASGHTYLVFRDRATADEVIQEIATTPILPDGLAWPVQIWDEDAGTAIGTFEAADGKVALGHRWTNAERAWMAEYANGWRDMEILEALPADWQPAVID